MNCQEIFDRLQDYLDRELSESEQAQVRVHLDACPVCADEYRFEANVLRFIAKAVASEPCPGDLAARVARALDCAI